MAGKKPQPTKKVTKDNTKNKVPVTNSQPPPAEPKLNVNEPKKPIIENIRKEREYVIKSPLDSNDYVVIHLPNGLKVFLISTCRHETDLGDEQINSKTGTFVKVEEFNQKFVNLPSDDKCRRTSSKGDNNEYDCSWEPQRKKARMISGSKCDDQPEPSTATINLAVGAGSLNDPADLPGLAHLCEHAVASFGSRKYPAGSFANEIQAAQGIYNAVTFEENTVYYFQLDLNSAGIERMERLLDILADFVGYPLLPAKMVNQEVHAVDCEFGLRETHDGSRMWTLLCSTSDKEHPFGRFACGNYNTLNQSNLHERMCEWQKRHYAANYMSLTIKAELPLEELEQLSRKYFSNVPQSPQQSPKAELLDMHGGNPFDTTEFRKIYSVFPVCDVQLMVISWVLPVKFSNDYKTKPFVYLGSLFGQHCSLIRALRKEHWVYEINAGAAFGKCQNPFCSMFSLRVQLTDEGVLHMNEVIAAIFSYLKMIEEKKPQEWIFNELRREKADVFHYQNTSSCNFNEFLDVACSLQDFKESKFLLTSRSLMTDFDATILNELTTSLTPRNMNVIICSKSFENICDEVEPWHQTRYHVNDFNPDFLKTCENPQVLPGFELHKENTFQQKTLACPLKSNEVLPEPRLLLRTAKAHVAYLKMNMCTPGTIPFGVYGVTINSPMARKTPSASGLLSIWVHLVLDNLRQTLGQSERAGIITQVDLQSANSIRLTLAGTPAKHTSTFKTIMDTFLDVDENAGKRSFNDYREFEIKTCKNHLLNPEHFALDLRNFVLLQNHYMHDHVRAAIETETFDHFLTYVETFKQRMFVQAELFGCIPEANATAMAAYIEKLDYNELPELLTAELSRATQLPLGERCIRVKSRNELDQVSRVINHYQFGNLGKEEQGLVKKLAHLIFIPAFNQLRGEEHLSYVVHVIPSKYCGISGLEIHVSPQPHRHTTGFVDERIDAFLANFRKKFASFSEISKVFGSHSGGICSQEEHKILVNMYDNFLLPSGVNFRKLSIQVVGHFDETKEPRSTPKEPTQLQVKIKNSRKQKIGTVEKPPSSPFAALNIGLDIPEEVNETNGYFITDLEAFKSSLFLYPGQD